MTDVETYEGVRCSCCGETFPSIGAYEAHLPDGGEECADGGEGPRPPRTPDVLVEQVLRGHPVGVGGFVRCNDCGRPVREGQPCSVLAYRLAADELFTVSQFWCAGCAPDSLESGIAPEKYLVEAEVGVAGGGQHHWLVLTLPAVADAVGQN